MRVGTYNLCNGGLDGGSDKRLRRQSDLLAELDLDLVALQEARWGEHALARLHTVAARLEMGFRVLVPSNHHGCHLVIMVREREGLRVVHERHDQGPPFWHALAAVELAVAGRDRPVHFVNVHLAPGNPGLRVLEAAAVKLYCKGRDVVAVGDINGVPLGYQPDLEGVDPAHAADKLHPGAARELAKAGLIDVASHVGDTTPTVGHTRADRLAYPCDQLHTNLPVSALHAYRVVQPPGTTEHLSDHLPVLAELDLSV